MIIELATKPSEIKKITQSSVEGRQGLIGDILKWKMSL